MALNALDRAEGYLTAALLAAMTLLTREAFELYSEHLVKDGVLAVHVSNLYLDLAPLVRSVAAEVGLAARLVRYRTAPGETGCVDSTWVLCCRDPAFFGRDLGPGHSC